MTALATLEPLADRIHAVHEEVTREIVDEHYRRHPDWWDRWGQAGHEATTRDTGYHLEFLEAALRTRREDVFAWYSAWLASVLRARGVPIEAVHEAYDLLEERLADRLAPPDLAHVRPFLQAGSRALDERPEPVPGGAGNAREGPPPTGGADALTRALLKGNRKEAERVLRGALDRGIPYDALADAIVQPAMAEIGRLWQTNRITVAQEHLATATLQTVLALLAAGAACEPPCERVATFACVEGSHHAVGLRAVADVFELAGWDVDYLGADVPTRDLIHHLRDRHPEVLCLSLSLPQHVASTRRAIDAIRAELGDDRPRILVGGLPVREFPGLLHVLGADGVALGARGALGGAEA